MNSFKDQYREFQYMCKEVKDLFSLNNEKETKNKFIFAQAALLCVTIERLLRVLPQMKSLEKETLSNFLDRAFRSKIPLFPFDGGKNKYIADVVLGIRNGIVHGNFEQRAISFKTNKRNYFRCGHFHEDVGGLLTVLNAMLLVINPSDGKIDTVKCKDIVWSDINQTNVQ